MSALESLSKSLTGRCDLQKEGGKAHNLAYGLKTDPLKREIKRVVDGKETTKVMKLCKTCYEKARIARNLQDIESGKSPKVPCDLQEEGGKAHNLASGLKTDPLKREIKRVVDGKETKKVMKLCEACYQKALIARRVQDIESGKSPKVLCDLQEEGGKAHNLASGLNTDPLKREIKRVVDGEETTKVMKLCKACYQKARIARNLEDIESGESSEVRCDLQKEGGKAHNLASGLNTDPLKREIKRVVGGEETTKVMKLCQACYTKAYRARRVEDIESGNRTKVPCDLQKEGGEPHNLAYGLNTDPLKREIKRVVDGEETTKVMKICKACYEKARIARRVQDVESGKSPKAPCDLQKEGGKAHNLASGLKTDPFKREIKRVVAGEETTKVMKICQSCYQKARIALRKRKAKSDQSDDVEQEVAPKVVKTIKQEPYGGDEDCSILQVKKNQREIDNSLPILQHPQNPEQSLLFQAEGLDCNESIRCADWNVLSDLTPSQKNKIKEEVLEWIRLNENDRETYANKLKELFEVTIPIDGGPSRGQSVFAKQDIKQYQVVCPYAGALHGNADSLETSIRKNGSVNILAYLFGTRSSERTVDAYQTGNVASLVNTSQLGDGPAFKENNLTPLIFGKNLVFYVALRDIAKGEELFLSYGDNYNPLERVNIKQEESFDDAHNLKHPVKLH